MKKLFNSFSLMLMLLFTVAACDDANNTTEYYFDGIYSVRGEMLLPEQEDTFYVAPNIKSMGLSTGDRALMRVRCFVDNVLGPRAAQWSVDRVYSMLPAADVERLSHEDSLQYDSPLAGITSFANYGSTWVWNAIQNICVVYYGNGTEPDFRMTAPAFVNDTLCLTLLAKIEDGEKPASQLLSFDLASALSLMSVSEQGLLAGKDTLRTKVMMRYYDAPADTVYTAEIFGGKCVNPFRK